MNAKDWKTTVLGVISGALVLAGVLWPDALDADTQLAVSTAFSQVLTGIGGLLAVWTGLRAKD